MKILIENPPNHEEVSKVFPLKGNEIFAWGDTIYNPGGGKIPSWLVEHEKVHSLQQKNFGSTEGWWDRYLVDDIFRLE